MSDGKSQLTLDEAQETIRVLQQELAETNTGLVSLTLELEGEAQETIRVLQQELAETSTGLVSLTLELKELEQRVLERTVQLEATNKELEAFSYSVSHDLRAPLRSIHGFSRAVLENNYARLDEQGVQDLNRVCKAAERMGLLIDDLLALSRATRAEMRDQRVDLGRLAEQIAAELGAAEPKRRVDADIREGLFVLGDQRLLALMMRNLVENAWKFTAKRDPALIEVGRTDTEEPAFFVRDNGAGFDDTYADKLFQPFQRLHPSRDFPGTGIGLALVQRVVHRHGGRVWAEGQVDSGATFYFTLPGVHSDGHN